jgi:hypothetical protein
MTDQMDDDFFEESEEKPKNQYDPMPPKPKNDLASPLPPVQERKRNRLTCGCISCVVSCALACCILPVIVLAIFLGLVAVARGNTITDQRTETLAISDMDTINLVVSNTTGLISIRGEDDIDEIQVEITRKGQGLSGDRSQELLDSIVVDVRQDGDQYILEVSDSEGGFPEIDEATADLRITVPRRLNIDATNEEGGITIRGVEIADSLMLENDVGGIEFQGRIGPEGTHEIRSDVGGVSMDIDRASSFSLDARADVGGIDVALDLENSDILRDGPSGRVTGIYGEDENPDATLLVIVSVGGIEIHD